MVEKVGALGSYPEYKAPSYIKIRGMMELSR
jgi:hypothetical protein